MFTVQDFIQQGDPHFIEAKYGIICSNKEEALECCEWMDSVGNTWRSGDKFQGNLFNSFRYQDGVIVFYNSGQYTLTFDKNRQNLMDWADFKLGLQDLELNLASTQSLELMLDKIGVF